MIHKKIMDILLENGFEVYIVGGFVRDLLLGKEGTDIDLVTNASVEEMETIFKSHFSNIDYVGKNFGVLIVDGIEVAQYRSETYNVASKPDVELTDDLYVDSNRRDFTINSLYMNKEGKIIDPHGGIDDLNNKMIVSVGNPVDRFTEDPSRILRGVYLSSKLGFRIEENLKEVIKKSRYMLDEVPGELKGKILNKALDSGGIDNFLLGLCELNIFDKVFKNTGWDEDSLFHALGMIELKENSLDEILTFLYFDVDSEIIKEDLHYLGINKNVYNRVILLVNLFSNLVNFNKLDLLRVISSNVRSKNEMFEVINNCDNIFYKIDIYSKFNYDEYFVELRKIVNERIFFTYELIIDGTHLIKKGYIGKEIGEILRHLVENNINDMTSVEKYLDNLGG